VGRLISVSRLISPKRFMPISTTAASKPASICRRVWGRPMRLFRFRSFFNTRKNRDSTRAVISLAVVLPQLPVREITGILKRRRQAWARSPRAVRVSATATAVTSGERGVLRPFEPRNLSSTTTPRTPRPTALGR
jgi:hypothetical protein